jgi:BASS family bile acid:Na+ symporter
MLKPVLDIAVPALVFLMMAVVGLGLTAEDFRRVARRPGLVAAATLGQFVWLPLIGLVLVRSLGLSPLVEKGVLLVAACPAGSMANFYNYLARANVALSVSLTAVACLAAVLTMPILLLSFRAYLGDAAPFAVPVPVILRQLLLTLVAPVLAGMALRRLWPAVTERHQRGLFGLSLVALAALIGFVIANEAEHFVGEWPAIAQAVILLSALAMLAGYVTGWLCRADAADRFTTGMVFVVRNVGVATALAVTALGDLEFAVFATAYFLSQVPILLAAVVVFRWRGVLTGPPRTGPTCDEPSPDSS